MNRHFDKEFFVFAIFLFAATGILWYYMSLPLCGACPLIANPGGKEVLNMEFASFSSDTNVTLNLRNTGSTSATLQSYFVKDSMGDQWQLINWSPPGQPVAPNNLLIVNIAIGSSTSGCGNGCQYMGTPGGFTTFESRQTYTVIVVTARNNQFTFTVIR